MYIYIYIYVYIHPGGSSGGSNGEINNITFETKPHVWDRMFAIRFLLEIPVRGFPFQMKSFDE